MSPAGAKVVVVGQGYVGLTLAIRAVEMGYRVVGLDTDETRVKTLSTAESVVEDVSSERIRKALDSGRYVPTSDHESCSAFDIAVITVPTPLRDGNPDLSYVIEAGNVVATHLRFGAMVVLESTTYPGTTEEVLGPILAAGSGLRVGEDFRLGYSPERIDPGNRLWTLVNTPKLVAGVDAASLEAVKDFYDTIVSTTVPVSSPQVAEMAKVFENTFRHVNIALVNELSMLASDLDVSVWEVTDAAATKPFGYLPFLPGPGVGGHCLPIDPTYLSWRVNQSLGHNFRLIDLANDLNAHMPDYIVRRTMLHLNSRQRAINGSRILVLGLSYKANIGDTRESPSIAVVEKLVGLGAEVRVADPHVDESVCPRGGVRVTPTTHEIAAADVVLVLTAHDGFDWTMISQQAQSILDTRGRLRPSDRVELL